MIASDILRSQGRFAVGAREVPWLSLLATIAVASALYGAIMGTWSERALQVCYSGLKAPILIGMATLICLPNFYVMNTVLGLRDDLRDAARGIFASQATLALFLVGAAPFTIFVYLNGCSYPVAKLTNGACFLGATLAGQWTLARHYLPLIKRNPKHRLTLVVWILLYQFVSVQLAWSLRPFIGDPGTATTFFRPEFMTNGYVEAIRALREAGASTP